jgi:capsular exopolysaccharide synthesis family protein
MEQSPETRSLRDYLRAIKAHRWLVIGTTLAAIAASILYSVARTPVYEATATISARSDFNLSQGQSTTQGAGADAALLATRPDVLAVASRLLHGQRTAQQLSDDASAAAVKDVNAADIKAKASTADQAAQIANTVAAAVVQVTFNQNLQNIQALQNELKKPNPAQVRTLRARARSLQPIRIAIAAVPPGSPTSPRPLRDVAFAALLGLLLGIAIALVRDALDRTVTDPDDLESTLGFPLLGYVRSDILGTAPASRNGTIETAEHLDSFRILRANTQFLGGDRPVATLAVTSPLPDEGKSTVAVWYAYANALGGKRTILVECDLHRPVVASGFDLDPSPGLTDYLTGDAEASDVRRSVMVEGPTAQPLSVVPAGASTTGGAELLATTRFEKFLDEVAREYELVVLDCPPLLPVGDTLSIVPRVDGVILCVRLGQTTRDQAVAAKDALRRLPERPVGLVLTDSKPGSEYEYAGYSSSVEEPPEVAATGRVMR